MAKKAGKSVVLAKELTAGDLDKLAHEGTKEAMEKIGKYIKAEKDADKKEYAIMALEECGMFYYEPTNEKEEEEFMLSALIMRREEDRDDLLMQADAVQMRIERLALEKKVHEKVLAKNKDKKEAWQFNWMTDVVMMEKQELQEIEDEIAYEEAWLQEAKKMITTKRYKNIPAIYLEHFNFDEEYCDDCDECGYDGDCCDCEDSE
jgi:hypothetical protein